MLSNRSSYAGNKVYIAYDIMYTEFEKQQNWCVVMEIRSMLSYRGAKENVDCKEAHENFLEWRNNGKQCKCILTSWFSQQSSSNPNFPDHRTCWQVNIKELRKVNVLCTRVLARIVTIKLQFISGVWQQFYCDSGLEPWQSQMILSHVTYFQIQKFSTI